MVAHCSHRRLLNSRFSPAALTDNDFAGCLFPVLTVFCSFRFAVLFPAKYCEGLLDAANRAKILSAGNYYAAS
jgi:hypothetical protein